MADCKRRQWLLVILMPEWMMHRGNKNAHNGRMMWRHLTAICLKHIMGFIQEVWRTREPSAHVSAAEFNWNNDEAGRLKWSSAAHRASLVTDQDHCSDTHYRVWFLKSCAAIRDKTTLNTGNHCSQQQFLQWLILVRETDFTRVYCKVSVQFIMCHIFILFVLRFI